MHAIGQRVARQPPSWRVCHRHNKDMHTYIHTYTFVRNYIGPQVMSEAVKRHSRPRMPHVIYDMQKCLYAHIHTNKNKLLKHVRVNGFWIFCNGFVVVLHTYSYVYYYCSSCSLICLHARLYLFVCMSCLFTFFTLIHRHRGVLQLPPPSKFYLC